MPYLVVVNEMTMNLRDDEERTRTRTLEINSIFTNTDDVADAHALCMRGTVDRYAYRQKQAFDGVLEVGADGDVNDKTNLIFRNDRLEKVVFPIYDLEPECFVAATGALARTVRDKADLETAADPDPGFYLNQIIDWVLDGTIIIGGGDTIVEYVEGYKVD